MNRFKTVIDEAWKQIVLTIYIIETLLYVEIILPYENYSFIHKLHISWKPFQPWFQRTMYSIVRAFHWCVHYKISLLRNSLLRRKLTWNSLLLCGLLLNNVNISPPIQTEIPSLDSDCKGEILPEKELNKAT